MRVKFKRTFFAKDGNRYRKDRWYNVPDDWLGHLPRDAVIDDSIPGVEPVPEKGPKTVKATAKSVL